MKTKSGLPKKEVTRFLKHNTLWSINDAGTTATGEFLTTDYISGLMFLSKVVVIAEVNAVTPACGLQQHKVTVKISATQKNPLTVHNLDFATKITDMFLSTKMRQRRF